MPEANFKITLYVSKIGKKKCFIVSFPFAISD